MRWIRKHVYWIASVVVGGFLLWLVATAVTVQSIQSESAGTLFGRSVPMTDYLKTLQAVTHRAVLTHGDKLRQNVSIKDLEDQAWERLLLLQEARRKGIRVSDREVIQVLQSSPLFLDSGGRFDSRGYQVVMQYTLGTTPRVFEEELREEILIQKTIAQAVGSPAGTQEEIAEKRLQNYMAWRQDLLKRAKPEKKISHPASE